MLKLIKFGKKEQKSKFFSFVLLTFKSFKFGVSFESNSSINVDETLNFTKFSSFTLKTDIFVFAMFKECNLEQFSNT